MGRIAQTWELISESFAVLKSDKALILLSLFSGLFCLLVSIAILGGAGLIFLPPSFSLADAHRQPMSQGMWITLLLFYLGNYFVIAFFNVALVSAASNRLAGGRASINDGLELAWQRKGKIFQWALLSATVGDCSQNNRGAFRLAGTVCRRIDRHWLDTGGLFVVAYWRRKRSARLRRCKGPGYRLLGLGLRQTLQQVAGRTVFIHVKDSMGTAEKFQFLLPGDSGKIDYKEYAQILREIGYRGPVTVEVSVHVSNQPGYDGVAAAKHSFDNLAPFFA